jgi:hypothetical protein
MNRAHGLAHCGHHDCAVVFGLTDISQFTAPPPPKA